MPTFDITRTALSALIFFCFLHVKKRPLVINYDLKLANLVTCFFFHKLPQPPSKALYNLNERRGTESRNSKYPTLSVFRPGVLKLCPELRLGVSLHRGMCGALCAARLRLGVRGALARQAPLECAQPQLWAGAHTERHGEGPGFILWKFIFSNKLGS